MDELENAITNLGMDPKQVDVEMLIREADKRGNHQIDFDEFCEVMKTMSEKSRSWNEVTKECFSVFDRVRKNIESATLRFLFYSNSKIHYEYHF